MLPRVGRLKYLMRGSRRTHSAIASVTRRSSPSWITMSSHAWKRWPTTLSTARSRNCHRPHVSITMLTRACEELGFVNVYAQAFR